ncbi:aminoglycoside phosphotransferase family protein [Nostocoides sp.]|uniref:aminoglycoside phosphotransferase family protein n=1 Tax=Nostocoides sp. TaxID=1917966 RepID=UPI002CD996D3|nr:aminoglycoside phosphotransferase family protein [Tetrasphaera sp.]
MRRRDAEPEPGLVAQLLQDQAPDLAENIVRPGTTTGSSNWVFRLGDELAVRLPRSDSYADDLRTEIRWLPRLGPQLPVAVPRIVFEGEPSARFPRPWAVVTWVPGQLPHDQTPSGQIQLARSLAHFVRCLHAVDTWGESAGPERWGYRSGEPVTARIERWLLSAAHGLDDLFDPMRVHEAWRRLRDVPAPSRPPCWVHADLSSENVLVGSTGELVGVIDFAGLGIGDHAVDFLYAWSLFEPTAREVFRVESLADEATWRRARAWAFVGPGLVTILNYRHAMPERTEKLIAMVEAVAAEVGVDLRPDPPS